MDDSSTDHGKHRSDSLDPLIGHFRRIEKIVAEHHDIAKLAWLDGSALVLFVKEPAIVRDLKPQRFHAGELLAGID
jgi:hypothetical protein